MENKKKDLEKKIKETEKMIEDIKKHIFSKKNEMKTTRSINGSLKKLDVLEKRKNALLKIYKKYK